jgi:hypothetical protein
MVDAIILLLVGLSKQMSQQFKFQINAGSTFSDNTQQQD